MCGGDARDGGECEEGEVDGRSGGGRGEKGLQAGYDYFDFASEAVKDEIYDITS